MSETKEELERGLRSYKVRNTDWEDDTSKLAYVTSVNNRIASCTGNLLNHSYGVVIFSLALNLLCYNFHTTMCNRCGIVA